MNKVLTLVALCFVTLGLAQSDNEKAEALEYQISENKKFASAETTILTPEDFENFKELEFFPIDLKYKVVATLIRTPTEVPFLMPTTTDRLPEYVKYGEVHFSIKEENYKLNVYQNTTPSEDPEYIDYLFLPFTDLTSGEESYGGGRFLDAKIPENNTLIIDFNKAYNPYCAYNSRYSCPITPKENHIEVAIKAGVKAFAKNLRRQLSNQYFA